MSKYIGTESGLIGPVTMEKPHPIIDEADTEYWHKKVNAYNQHLASLPTIPCVGWVPVKGQEYTFGVDFDILMNITHWDSDKACVVNLRLSQMNPDVYDFMNGTYNQSEWHCTINEQVAVLLPAANEPIGFMPFLKELKNYFGEHDKTTFEHKAFAMVEKMIQSIEAGQTVPAASQEGAIDTNYTRLRKCYEKYTSLLAEQLYQFRSLAKEIHEWSIEKNLERKIKALDRLELEYYQLSIKPESNEMIIARKNLADALEFFAQPAPAANDGGDGWLGQTLKELDIYLDALATQTDKDAGNLWIAFTDKFNAFKKSLLQQQTYPAEFVEWMAQHTLRKGFDQYQYYKSGALFTKERLYTEWNKTKQ